MKKKLLALALSLALTLSLFPVTALADEPVVPPDTSTNPFHITSGLNFDSRGSAVATQDCTNTDDASDLMGAGVKHDHAPADATSMGTPCWSWVRGETSADVTLTINDISLAAATGSGIVFSQHGGTIVVNGMNNTITGAQGIFSSGAVTIKSDTAPFGLTVTNTAGIDGITRNHGISASILIIDGGTGAPSTLAINSADIGISASSALQIANTNVTVRGEYVGINVNEFIMTSGKMIASATKGTNVGNAPVPATAISLLDRSTAVNFSKLDIKQKDEDGSYTVPTFFNDDEKYISLTSETATDRATDVTVTAHLNVMAEGLGSGGDAGGYYEADDVVAINAGTKSGYTFSGWTFANSDGTTIAAPTFTTGSASTTSATFTMPTPAVDITVTANWTVIPSSGGGGTPTKTVTNPDGSVTKTVTTTKTDAASGAKVVTKTETTTAKDGTVTKKETATISGGRDGSTASLVTQTSAEGVVSVVGQIAAKAGERAVQLPAVITNAAKKSTDVAITLTVGDTALVLDAAHMAALTAVAGSDAVKISIAPVADADLPAAVQGKGAAYAFTVNGKGVDFGKNPLSVTIDYTKKDESKSVGAFYLAADGALTRVTDATYQGGKASIPQKHWATYVVVEEDALPFADLAESDWCYGAVRYAYEAKLFNGTSATTFAPEDTMTRAMFWTVLYRQAGSPAVMGAADLWYGAAQQWAQSTELSDGTSPNDHVTREQLATTLWRNAGSPQSSGNLNQFGDAATVASYAQAAMIWAVENRIIGGTGDGRIDPQGSATRAQVSAMLARALTA